MKLKGFMRLKLENFLFQARKTHQTNFLSQSKKESYLKKPEDGSNFKIGEEKRGRKNTNN